MSDDFSDIDGGHEPLFADYEDEDLDDVPALPPPLAILNSPTGGGTALDNGGDMHGDLSFTQQTNLFADEAADTSRNDQSMTGPSNKKRKPMLIYNEGRITSSRGLQAIMNDFANIKFKGKGHEKSDLKLLMMNYEEWANRMFPKLAFDDIVERTEKLGAKKEVKSLLHQFRSGITPVGEEVVDDEDHVSTGVDHVSTGASTGAHQTEENTAANRDSDDLMQFVDVNDQGNPLLDDQVDEWPEDMMNDLPMVDINGATNPTNQRPRTVGDMNTSQVSDTGVDDRIPSLDEDQSHQDSSHITNADDPVLGDQGHQGSPLTHDTCDDQAQSHHDGTACGNHASDHHFDNQDSLIDSVRVDDHNDDSNHVHLDQNKVLTQPMSDIQGDSLTHDQVAPNSESLVSHDEHGQDECTLTDGSKSLTQQTDNQETSLTHHDQESQEPLACHDELNKSQHDLMHTDNQNDLLHEEADQNTDHLFNDISIDDFINDDV